MTSLIKWTTYIFLYFYILLLSLIITLTYLTAGDESGKIIQSDECHKAADVFDKPGGRI